MYRATKLMIVPVVLLLSGCLSPATLRPVADQNSQNIQNYNANVATLVTALKKEAAFHTKMDLATARIRFGKNFEQLVIKNPKRPSQKDIADPENEVHKTLQKQVDDLKGYMKTLSDLSEKDDELRREIVAKDPLAADIVLQTPGFSVTRVVTDAYDYFDLSKNQPSEGKVRLLSLDKLNAIVDQYTAVKQQKDIEQAYLDALEKYTSTVLEQARIAQSHANSISAYAQTTPQIATLSGALQNKDLQAGVLDLVKKEKGEAFAQHMEEYMTKAGSALQIVSNLTHPSNSTH